MIQSVNITEWVGKMTPTKVALSLPKFTLDFENAELYLSLIKQKAFLKVDEHGAEAAAVTLMTFDEKCMMPDNAKPIEMNVNRPFIFTIEDNSIENISIFYAKITSIKE